MRARGTCLAEVVVALVLLEVGVLGAAGLVVAANRALSRAAGLERAAALAGAVGDSLVGTTMVEPGHIVHGRFVVAWEPRAGGTSISVRRAGAEAGLVELFLPRGELP